MPLDAPDLIPMCAPEDVPSDAVLDRTLDRVKGHFFFHSFKGTGWLGSLLCNHEYIWSERNSTAWCNGKTIGFNRVFFWSLPMEQRVFLLAHELMHTMLMHMIRRGNRDPKLWNIAADYVINGMLDTWGFSMKGMGGYLDHQYDDMSTEEVYDLLLQEQQQIGQPPQPCQGGQGGMSADDVVEPGQEGQGDAGGDPGGSQPGSGGSIPKDAETAIVGKVAQAVQVAESSKTAGTLPGELRQVLDKFLDPVLPWEVLLHNFMNELSQDDYSWRRPSRRWDANELYLPSILGDNGLEHLIYYVDVSGSISDGELLRFFSEVRAVHKDLEPKKLTVVTFDTKIQQEVHYDLDDPFDSFEIIGRGGTALDPVRKHILKHRPNAAVIFSDLYVTPMTQNPGVPILWIIMDNKDAQTHFGRRIHLKREHLENV